MRADRLLSIMLLLQVHRLMTARELAERLEVSERTIHRDMEALSAAGIPVFAERGSHGGWALMEEYRTNLTGLNKDEIQALFATRPSRLLADLGLEKASDAALIKLLAAIPSGSRDDAEYARQRIYVDTSGWNSSRESVESLPVIQSAVWQERKLKFSYQRGVDCDPVERVVDPLGLVAKGSAWYLVASVEGQVRSYRVSRVVEASALDERCTRPKGFDLAAFWEQSAVTFKENFPRYYATLRAHPDILPRMYFPGRFARVERVDPPDEHGWVKVLMRFQFEHEACEYALGFGSLVEAVEPATLREKVVEAAKNVIAFYASKTPGRGATA
ncbi:MAG TPA: YafY family protein [Blastocatellia bacterium]|nr:YafY family protein [Blastocatellia bacterium]